MGILTDYFAAKRENIVPAMILHGPRGHVPDPDYLPGKGIDHLRLERLGVQLTNDPDLKPLARRWSRTPDGVTDDPQSMDVDGGVCEFTDRLRDALAAVDDEERLAVARDWAAIEEFEGVTGEALLPYLTKLLALARRAAAQGDRLYLWWSV